MVQYGTPFSFYFHKKKLQSFSVIDINTPEGGYLEVKEDAKGFAHIAHYKSLSPNIEPVWITAGAYEVTQIVAVDAKTKLVYVQIESLN